MKNSKSPTTTAGLLIQHTKSSDRHQHPHDDDLVNITEDDAIDDHHTSSFMKNSVPTIKDDHPSSLVDSIDSQLSNHFVPLIEKLQNEIVESKAKICTIIDGYENKIAQLKTSINNTPNDANNTTTTLLQSSPSLLEPHTSASTLHSEGSPYFLTLRKSMEFHQEQLTRSRLEKEKQTLQTQLKEMEKNVDKIQFSNTQYQRNLKNIEREKAELEKQIISLEKIIHQNNEKYQKLLVQTRKEKEKLLADNREEIQNLENNYQEEIRQLRQAIKKEQEKTLSYKAKFEDAEKQLSFLQHETKLKIQGLESENRRLQSDLKTAKQMEDSSNKSSLTAATKSSNMYSSVDRLESPRYYGRYNPNVYY
ncbi:hypothetical protein FDP41_002352 [Naegleria fowleri]|uniref:Uncharacterized protein n=1 Tax=Naegleria fowleri TaxID=5763 RepID=A0A6A5BV64_NAEFO|nr:uncharacterized protein FDP41_002352 [Naegleria fowleri]KAF0978532.1 hypothetical protein FDP41_002352 [Naegleria fowleri]